jgi:hypothetical protein
VLSYSKAKEDVSAAGGSPITQPIHEATTAKIAVSHEAVNGVRPVIIKLYFMELNIVPSRRRPSSRLIGQQHHDRT